MSGRSALRAAMGNRDANHGDVTAWYTALYCTVVDSHSLGFGFPDLIVKVTTKRGPVVALVEVKGAGGRLSKPQERFLREWGSCVTVVQTREEVFAHVERVRHGP